MTIKMSREEIECYRDKPNHALNGITVDQFRHLCDLALSPPTLSPERVREIAWESFAPYEDSIYTGSSEFG